MQFVYLLVEHLSIFYYYHLIYYGAVQSRLPILARGGGIYNYECLGKKYYCEWKFYSSQGTLQVLVPVFLTEEKIREMEKPQVDQKVKLNYYKYSKILRSWEVVGDSKCKK